MSTITRQNVLAYACSDIKLTLVYPFSVPPPLSWVSPPHLLYLFILVDDSLTEVAALRVGGEQLQADGVGDALGLLQLRLALLCLRVGHAEPFQHLTVLQLLGHRNTTQHHCWGCKQITEYLNICLKKKIEKKHHSSTSILRFSQICTEYGTSWKNTLQIVKCELLQRLNL